MQGRVSFIFFVFVFLLNVRSKKVILLQRFGRVTLSDPTRVDPTCSSQSVKAKNPIHQIDLDKCFFNGKDYLKFTYSSSPNTISIGYFEDWECQNELSTRTFTIDTCVQFSGFSERNDTEYSKFVYSDELVFENSSEVHIEHYHDKLCDSSTSSVQYITKFHAGCSTKFATFCVDGVARTLEYSEKTCETVDRYQELFYSGCEHNLNTKMSTKYYCGTTESEIPNESAEDTASVLLPVCIDASDCSDKEYMFAFEMPFEECRYDYINDQFFRYVTCSEKYHILIKEFYSGSYCREKVDYYQLEHPFLPFGDISAVLYCNLKEFHNNPIALVLDSYYDEDCLIRSDRILHFPVRGGCKKFKVQYEGLLVPFGMTQQCVGLDRLEINIKISSCDEGNEVFVDMGQPISDRCAPIDPYLLEYEPRFPYAKLLNKEFCRTCGGIHHYINNSCSSHGRCVAQDECVCQTEFAGSLCAEISELKKLKDFFINYWWSILLPVLVISFAVILGVFMIIFICTFVRVSRRRKIVIQYAPKDPKKEVTIVFTDIENSTALFEVDPKLMSKAIELHNEVIRGLIKKYEAYEVKTIGDAFMVAFSSPWRAVLFAMEVQNELTKIEYPKEFLYLPGTDTVFGENQEIIYRGLRVRMGIHSGSCQIEYSTTRNQYDYLGTNVNLSSRIESSSPGGRVFVSKYMYDKTKNLDFANVGGGVRFEDVGEWNLKGIDGKQRLYCVYQKGRKYRSKSTPSYDDDNVIDSNTSADGADNETDTQESEDRMVEKSEASSDNTWETAIYKDRVENAKSSEVGTLEGFIDNEEF